MEEKVALYNGEIDQTSVDTAAKREKTAQRRGRTAQKGEKPFQRAWQPAPKCEKSAQSDRKPSSNITSHRQLQNRV